MEKISDKRTLRDMQHGARAFEKIARQRYFMKADDEDIFVLSSDIPEKTNEQDENETIE